MSLDPSVMIAFALTQLCGLLSRHPVCVETVNGCLTLFSVKFETPSYLLDSKVTHRQFARPTNEQRSLHLVYAFLQSKIKISEQSIDSQLDWHFLD